MAATYYGSTTGSSVCNPLFNIVAPVKGAPGVWGYSSTATATDAKTANFFKDAFYLGVQQNDILLGVNRASTSAPKTYMGAFGAVSTSGAALASAVSSTAA